MEDDSASCSGHGECRRFDDCACEPDFFGAMCSETSCYAVNSSDSSVCSSAGSCIAKNICRCKFGFSEDSCSAEDVFLTRLPLFIVLLTVIPLLVACVGLGVVLTIVVLLAMALRFGRKLKKVEKLEGLDILLEEQAMQKSGSIAVFKIDKSMYHVKYAEIKITKLIGTGGSSSSVFLARYRNLDVAFKMWKIAEFASQDSLTEFEQETELLSSLSHPK